MKLSPEQLSAMHHARARAAIAQQRCNLLETEIMLDLGLSFDSPPMLCMACGFIGIASVCPDCKPPTKA